MTRAKDETPVSRSPASQPISFILDDDDPQLSQSMPATTSRHEEIQQQFYSMYEASRTGSFSFWAEKSMGFSKSPLKSVPRNIVAPPTQNQTPPNKNPSKDEEAEAWSSEEGLDQNGRGKHQDTLFEMDGIDPSTSEEGVDEATTNEPTSLTTRNESEEDSLVEQQDVPLAQSPAAGNFFNGLQFGGDFSEEDSVEDQGLGQEKIHQQKIGILG